MQDTIVRYPIKVSQIKDQDYSYQVYLPDFQGYTAGIDYENAIFMARDYIGTRSICSDLPAPSSDLPQVEEPETALFVKVNITEFRLTHGLKSDGYL
ncbi:hypothetical protein LFYK43_13510 [Ligilactobacillus salitolerans]|uniref:HicB-like antitoxin of toxin-antitoxin system domain-containing protein n=1 Tax=Ligilactobacillus salitolerans TaxID=1808352 RepID=A0A401ITN1_9LACO|nr:hypothetical protein [Ligilactobacillus salitolerans]GBG94892.1 hypothetical protein LFYK43_13510 [Ligilactobacillus salitolerans]